jgi:biotin-(acetyl-CoA carboxylase) ligase
VITREQTQGRGQRNRTWHYFPGALAMSFTFPLETILTLTPLKIACLVADFFQQYKVDLKLKWPNDLFTIHGEKVGGIIIDILDQSTCIIGLGINLNRGPFEHLDLEFTPGFISLKNIGFSNTEQLAEKLYLYLLLHQEDLNDQDIIQCWEGFAFHLNALVEYQDGSQTGRGFFKGLGSNGEALIQLVDGKLLKSTTLRLSPIMPTKVGSLN